MSNEVTNISNLSPEAVMKMVGQDSAPVTTLATMKTNREPEDDDGNKLPMGSFRIDNSSVGTIFGKSVSLRPLFTARHYKKYDENNEDNNCKSIMFTSWSDTDLPDTNGTQKCGSIPRKKREGLSQQELDEQDKIKCFKYVWGLATMKGVSATGKELSITDEPVLYSASGTNFMPMEQIIQGISQRNEVMINCILEFYDTQKEKKGSNIWYVAKIKESFTKPPALTEEQLKHLDMFKSIRDSENAYVRALHKEKQKSTEDVLDDDIVAELETA